MSLDVYLKVDYQVPVQEKNKVYVRRNGQAFAITLEQWREENPDRVPFIIEGDFETGNICFEANITHNLNKMAEAAGIYNAVWQPNENGMFKARDIIGYLKTGIEDMKARPDYYKQFDSSNGWGTYKDFVPWLEKYLAACEDFPEAIIKTSR